MSRLPERFIALATISLLAACGGGGGGTGPDPQGSVAVVEVARVEDGGNPALSFTVRNEGETTADNVIVEVNAIAGTTVVDQSATVATNLPPGRSATLDPATFFELASHDQFDCYQYPLRASFGAAIQDEQPEAVCD